MKILQTAVSENQKDAMFYHGVIASQGEFTLETEQDGEVGFEEHNYVGAETPKLGTHDVHDVDLEAEVIVDIYVDKFFTIKKDGKIVDEIHTVCNYDEAIEEFKNFFK